MLADVAALQALQGRGDATLGEWREGGNGGVYHIRRRLTDAEVALAGNLTVRDLRGTDEGRKRFAMLPPNLKDFAARIGEFA